MVSAKAKAQWYNNINLKLDYTDSSGQRHYVDILSAVSQGDWVEMNDGKFIIPNNVTNVYLYFECNDTANMYIDDFEIKMCRGCRKCHKTAECFQKDDVTKLMETYDWADKIVSVSPSYWADIPGQFKVFIDRCTPWCNTHEPHAKLSSGKKGYTIALRTGPSMPECERIISNIEHFYGHLEIEPCGKLGLCGVEYKEDLENRLEEIKDFCNLIKEQ